MKSMGEKITCHAKGLFTIYSLERILSAFRRKTNKQKTPMKLRMDADIT